MFKKKDEEYVEEYEPYFRQLDRKLNDANDKLDRIERLLKVLAGYESCEDLSALAGR